MGGLLQKRGLTVGRQSETDILMCLGAIDSEDRTVAGLQAILGITAVEGAVITFVTILTHDVTSVRMILQSSCLGCSQCQQGHKGGCNDDKSL